MHRHVSHRALRAALGLMLLCAAFVAFAPATAIAADEPQSFPPPVYVTATPYVTRPGYAGPYGIPQTYFVSIYDADPYGAAGCAMGDNACLATPREERPAPRPEPAPLP